MTFQRSQMLNFEGASLAQLAFLEDAGAPIAFCIMRGNGEANRKSIKIAGLNASPWAGGGCACILIGPAAADALDSAAAALQQRMPG